MQLQIEQKIVSAGAPLPSKSLDQARPLIQAALERDMSNIKQRSVAIGQSLFSITHEDFKSLESTMCRVRNFSNIGIHHIGLWHDCGFQVSCDDVLLELELVKDQWDVVSLPDSVALEGGLHS